MISKFLQELLALLYTKKSKLYAYSHVIVGKLIKKQDEQPKNEVDFKADATKKRWPEDEMYD